MGRNPVGVAESSVESPGLKQPWALGRNRFAVFSRPQTFDEL